MFGFPVNLQDASVQKMTYDADNGFQKIQRREVFYTLRNGIYESMQWQTLSGRVGLTPGIDDDVIIMHNVVINNTPSRVRNFIVTQSGYVTFTGALGTTISCYNYKNYGVVDFTIGLGSLTIYGNDNYFGNTYLKNTGASNTDVRYWGTEEQLIHKINYGRLQIAGGRKYINSDLYVNGDLTGGAFFDNPGYNVFVNGSASFGQGLKAVESATFTFVGLLQVDGSRFPAIDFEGSVNVECRGGVSFNYWSNINFNKQGSGTWRFTTNNQSIFAQFGTSIVVFDAQLSIAPGITLTNEANSRLYLNNVINGESGTSQLINKGEIYFQTLTSVSSMTTGISNISSFTNTIGYSGNYTATIPSYFTTFHNLRISGTGTKSLGVNTTLNGNLFCNSGNINLSTYDLFVNGTSTIDNGSTITKPTTGNITFVGNVTFANNPPSTSVWDMSGNPNIEFRNGLFIGGWATDPTTCWKSGTGTYTFSTNNQTINSPISGGRIYQFNGNIVISGNITLTTSNSGTGSGIGIQQTINGTTASSTLKNNGNIVFYNTLSQMTTGIVDITSVANTMTYAQTATFTLPYTTYHSLSILNASDKIAPGNLTLLGALSIDSNGILKLNTYDMYVTSTSYINNGTLSKTSSGNITFIGLCSISVSFATTIFDMTGNPNIEFRNGLDAGGWSTTFNGSPILNFTTNNQTLSSNYPGALGRIIPYQINISSGIELTLRSWLGSPNYVMTLTNIINGLSATSKLIVSAGSTINYQNTTQPMATGILDTSTNLNTFIYGSGNQDIKGGPTTGAKQVYRNLTLNGGGTKTLQGYVSVQNTYTLTSPATLNNNGFTLTNP